MADAKFLGPADDATTVFGAGDQYRFLATGDETDGTYFMVEAIVERVMAIAADSGVEFVEMATP